MDKDDVSTIEPGKVYGITHDDCKTILQIVEINGKIFAWCKKCNSVMSSIKIIMDKNNLHNRFDAKNLKLQ